MSQSPQTDSAGEQSFSPYDESSAAAIAQQQSESYGGNESIPTASTSENMLREDVSSEQNAGDQKDSSEVCLLMFPD